MERVADRSEKGKPQLSSTAEPRCKRVTLQKKKKGITAAASSTQYYFPLWRRQTLISKTTAVFMGKEAATHLTAKDFVDTKTR